MGYSVEAAIARVETFARITFHETNVAIVPLEQEFALIPFTRALLDEIHGGDHRGALMWDSQFLHLTQPLAAWIIDQSRHGPVAYVEAEYFAGIGVQSAVAWQQGEILRGPLHKARAINRVLREIGVQRTATQDQFDAIGLGRWRYTERWNSERI